MHSRANEQQQEQPGGRSGSGSGGATTAAPALAVEAAVKTFRQADGSRLLVLDGLSLTAASGEFVALVGPSGCGKSTLFSLIAGLDRPDAGRIFLDGDDITGEVGHVGYMPQRDLLLPWRRLIDNAILAPEVQGAPLVEARARATALLDRFGLAGFEQAYPAVLSGGMRQRAALLRTVMTGHRLLLLDEPFGALDALTRTDLQRWLLDLWSEVDATILLITHDVDEAIFLADRVYILTSRPARVALELPVDLPRPRTLESLTSDAFMRLKSRALMTLRDAGGFDAGGAA
jgi:ABC-type nitrate/sulfonate/bicarbonate transport system ATPase subunit